jgi:hypothetical protein
MLRSRVSNRPGGLAGVDGRSGRARRFRDLTSGLKRDIGRALSAAEQSLVDQAAALILQREEMTAVGDRGERIDSRELVRIAGAVARTLAALGLTQPSEQRLTVGNKRNSEIANESATRLDSSEVVSKILHLFEEATRTGNSTLLARAARVRELLSKVQLRKQ